MTAVASMLSVQVILPPPDEIRGKASEVVARPEYDLGYRPVSSEPPFWYELLRWLLKPFQWLFESLEGLPDALRWLIVFLAGLLCAALVAHMIYTLLKVIGDPARRRPTSLESKGGDISPDELESEADRVVRRGDYIGAIRLLFRAVLRRIELAEHQKFRPGFTNRELLRRYRASPLFAPLEQFVETIELKWYGEAPCVEADYLACRNEHDRICQYVRQSGPADGA